MTIAQRLAVLTTMLVASVATGAGQQVHIGVHGGYSFPASSSLFMTRVDGGRVQGIYGSLGEGARFGGSVGIMFTDHFGVEVGTTYLAGTTLETSTGVFGGNVSTLKYTGSGFQLFPCLILSVEAWGLRPYTRVGGVLGLLSVEELYVVRNDRVKIKYSGGMSVGLSAAAGIEFKTSGRFQLFVEALLISQAFGPTQAEITEYTINGVNLLSTIPNRKVKLEESFLLADAENTSLRPRVQFGSVGLLGGIRIII
jgi:hypothetical protein